MTIPYASYRKRFAVAMRFFIGMLLMLLGALASLPAMAAQPMSPGKSAASASPTTVAADGVSFSTITVYVAFTNGSPVSGATVTLTANGGSSVITTVSAVTNGSGNATFRVTDTAVEIVTYTATATNSNGTITILQKPQVSFTRTAPTAVKAFSPSTIAAGGTSTLTITLSNSNTVSLTSVAFTDSYPSNLVNGATLNLTNTCGGTVSASAGGGSLTLSGGTIAASSSCSVSVTVTSLTAGTYVNSTGAISSLNAAAGTAASATLTVKAVSATLSTVTASPTTVLADGSSTSTITVTLKDGSGVGVAGKTVTLAKSGGNSVISPASGVSNANGIVTFTVKDATAEGPITYTATDTTDSIVITQTAAVTFIVVPSVFKSFSPTTIAANGTSTLSIRLTNANPFALTSVAFTDSYPSNLKNATTTALSNTCGGTASASAGGTSLSLSNGTIAANSNCTVSVSVTSAVAGSYTNNTGTVATSYSGFNGASVSATLTVTAVSATLSTVTASPTSVLANGTSSSTITVTLKDGAGNAVSGKTVTLAKNAGSSTISTASSVSNASGQVFFTVKDTVAEGPITYTATDSTDSIVITQTAVVTFTPMTAPTVSKSFSPSAMGTDSTSTMTISLSNPNSTAITGVNFSDSYPSPLQNTSSATATTTCGGAVTAFPLDTSLSFSGGTIPANGSCSISIPVTASVTATTTITNTTSTVISTNATTSATASASLLISFIDSINSTVVANPTTVSADGTSSSTITVTVVDGDGLAVSGVTVTLTAGGGSSTISPASGVTDAAGQVAFTVKDTVSEAVTYTAAIPSEGVTLAQTATVTFTSPVSSFNAFETTTASTAITGSIYTEIAGSGFSLDIVAISGASKASTFNGTVKLELLANTGTAGSGYDSSNCPTSNSVIQTINSFAISNGRSTAAFSAVADVYRDVRVRITYTSTSTISNCSSDSFAIRPSTITFLVRDADRLTAGTARTLNNTTVPGGTVHNAGRPFQITATAYNAALVVTSNYAGTPTAVVTACGSAACTASLGTLTLGTWSASGGTATTSTASYDNVGAFTLQLQDTTFASIDASDGSTAAQRNIVSSTVDVGRFVPDHFSLAALGSVTSRSDIVSCSGSIFTYMGEPFGLSFTLRAENAANNVTSNYAGSLAQLTGTDATKWINYGTNDSLGLWAVATNITVGTDNACRATFGNSGSFTTSYSCPSATPPASVNAGAARVAVSTTPANPTGSWSSGVGTFSVNMTLNRANSPDGPFANLNIGIAPQDADGVTAGAFTLDADTTGGNERVLVSTSSVRYGRAKMFNSHGSELLSLTVPIQLQYYNGTAFVKNSDDTCTPFSNDNFAFDFPSPSTNTLAPACKTAVTLSGSSPSLSASLSAPGTGNSGLTDITLNLGAAATGVQCTAVGSSTLSSTARSYSWLQYNWTGSTGNPTSRATFGKYRSGPVIYTHEMY